MVGSEAGFSRGATDSGCSILGGCSSTLGEVGTSVFGLVLNMSVTCWEIRRASLEAFGAGASFVSFGADASFGASLTSSVTAATGF